MRYGPVVAHVVALVCFLALVFVFSGSDRLIHVVGAVSTIGLLVYDIRRIWPAARE